MQKKKKAKNLSKRIVHGRVIKGAIIKRLYNACVFAQVHGAVGRHNGLYKSSSFFISLPRGYLVFAMRAFQRSNFFARFAPASHS